jgi:hypothetical protein
VYTSENEKPGSPTPSVYLRLPGSANENAAAFAKGEGFSGTAAAALRRTSSTPARRVPATLLRSATSSAPAPPPAASGIDLVGYPTHRPDSAAYRVLVDASRGALAATGCASFPGFLTFLTPQATHHAAEEARAAAPRAFVADDTHNAYQLPGTDPNLPDNHPRDVPMRTRVASTAYDELAGSSRDRSSTRSTI